MGSNFYEPGDWLKCPFCGAQAERLMFNGQFGGIKMKHLETCFFKGQFMSGLVPMPMQSDFEAWNRRYTDAVGGETCKVTIETKQP